METDLSFSFVITVMKVGIAVLSMRRTIHKENMANYWGNLKTLQMPTFFFGVLFSLTIAERELDEARPTVAQ